MVATPAFIFFSLPQHKRLWRVKKWSSVGKMSDPEEMVRRARTHTHLEAIFEMTLPLAIPKLVKALLDDEKGRRYLLAQLSEASFHVVQDDSKSIMASKQDPTRFYGFLFATDCVMFKMRVYSDAIGNPHKFFLQTLSGEFHLIMSMAKEYLTGKAVSGNNEIGKPRKYIN